MRISDCSSYVCSSYLTAAAELSENIAKPIAQTVEHAPQILVTRPATQNTPVSETSPTSGIRGQCFRRGRRYARTQNARGRGVLYTNRHAKARRSEERRAGKECESTCRSRWSP